MIKEEGADLHLEKPWCRWLFFNLLQFRWIGDDVQG
jgi:hypothetical protein